jgi:CHAD domain-containing protein
MSFELKSQQSLRKNLRRIVRKQLDAAALLTGPHQGGRDDAVHEARKMFKKVRAVLRLVRPALGEKAYRAENSCFRDAARPLTEVRDAKILVETLDGLAEQAQGHVTAGTFGDARGALQKDLRAVRKRVLDEQNAFVVAGDMVRQERERVKDWANVPDKWSSLGPGIEGTYRRARAAFREADAELAVETLHEWRKQAKYLRYQLEVLRPLWPERLGELAGEADRMGELLGDDHDLAVLRQKLTEDPGRFGDAAGWEVLLGLLDRRRAELEQEALVLGRRFFQDRPRDFARRLKGYCKAWRAQAGRSLPATV